MSQGVTRTAKGSIFHVKVKVKLLSCVRLFATLWTIAYQVSLSMGFSRQGYWSGLLFPSAGDLLNPGIEPGSHTLQADALLSEPPGKSPFFFFFFNVVNFKNDVEASIYNSTCRSPASKSAEIVVMFGLHHFTPDVLCCAQLLSHI